MTGFPTLAERKQAQVAATRKNFAVLRERLREYAREHGGRFIIYGSAARDELRFDSDIDILVDFPASRIAAAWNFAEDACGQLGLTPDVRSVSYSDPWFVEKAERSGEVLG